MRSEPSDIFRNYRKAPWRHLPRFRNSLETAILQGQHLATGQTDAALIALEEVRAAITSAPMDATNTTPIQFSCRTVHEQVKLANLRTLPECGGAGYRPRCSGYRHGPSAQSPYPAQCSEPRREGVVIFSFTRSSETFTRPRRRKVRAFFSSTSYPSPPHGTEASSP